MDSWWSSVHMTLPVVRLKNDWRNRNDWPYFRKWVFYMMTNVDTQHEADTCSQMCGDIKIIIYRAIEKSNYLERTWTLNMEIFGTSTSLGTSTQDYDHTIMKLTFLVFWVLNKLTNGHYNLTLDNRANFKAGCSTCDITCPELRIEDSSLGTDALEYGQLLDQTQHCCWGKLCWCWILITINW